jgi:hypothetical protein
MSAPVDRFRKQQRVISSTESPEAHASANAETADMPPSDRQPRSESPYARRPAWFDPSAFNERMRPLQQPWGHEDAWKFET